MPPVVIADLILMQIDEIVGTAVPTYEDIQKFKYLPLVMKESMRYVLSHFCLRSGIKSWVLYRLFPSVSMQTTRITNQDTTLEKDGQVYHLPKNVRVLAMKNYLSVLICASSDLC